MQRRLPPLSALRSFEAAGRHENFSRAAEELHVTHAAVSHQIKALEQWLEVPLFERRTRAVCLSEAGRAYLPVIEGAFNQIDAGTTRLLAARSAQPLNIRTTPAFAVRWLAPRLGRFWSRYPKLDFRLHESSWMAEKSPDEPQMDLEVRVGKPARPGVQCVLLMPGTIAPMCSPVLLREQPAPRSPRDLSRYWLLHEFDYAAWQRWFEHAGFGDVDIAHGPIFSDINLVYSATLAGQGVGLLHTALTRDEVTAGQLVQPFAIHDEEDLAYYLAFPAGRVDDPRVAQFRDWLLSEAEGPRDQKQV